MKDIIIVGAAGFGREIYNYIEDAIKNGAQWRIKCFLDDNPAALDGYDYPVKTIFPLSQYQPSPEEAFVCALGDPKTKKAVVEKLKERGAKFITIVHPSARVGRNVSIGEGCVVCPNCSLSCDCKIGDFVMLNVGTSVGHDSQIGSWSTLSSHCDVTGFAQVGEGVFFASSVAVIPSSKVGDWARVGINSSVIMKVRGGASAFGNPAVKL